MWSLEMSFHFFNLLVFASSFLNAFESLHTSSKFGPSQSIITSPIDTLVSPCDMKQCGDVVDELVEASLL